MFHFGLAFPVLYDPTIFRVLFSIGCSSLIGIRFAGLREGLLLEKGLMS
jgi:uncharacterized membrane protein